jgi:HSP20 family molecular chaperone IbpA
LAAGGFFFVFFFQTGGAGARLGLGFGFKKTNKPNNVPERSYGSFSRSFWLPSDADEEHVDASFEDGVLTKRLPKTQARKPRASAVK